MRADTEREEMRVIVAFLTTHKTQGNHRSRLVVDVEEKEEADELNALMALATAKALNQSLTEDVIGGMQRDNLIHVFLKCAEFEQWPKKNLLAAFLKKLDAHPSARDGVPTKKDLVELVEGVLGNNS
jgi:hypothetical protein